MTKQLKTPEKAQEYHEYLARLFEKYPEIIVELNKLLHQDARIQATKD